MHDLFIALSLLSLTLFISVHGLPKRISVATNGVETKEPIESFGIVGGTALDDSLLEDLFLAFVEVWSSCSRCSGVAIGPQRVVTAAHCVFSVYQQNWCEPVKLRGYRYGWDLTETEIFAMDVPRCYKETGDLQCDIAVLTTHKALFNGYAMVYPEPCSSYPPDSWGKGWVVGIGRTSGGGNSTDFPHVLRIETGNYGHLCSQQISRKEFCFGRKNAPSACSGDSGGPVFYSLNTGSIDDHCLMGIAAGGEAKYCDKNGFVEYGPRADHCSTFAEMVNNSCPGRCSIPVVAQSYYHRGTITLKSWPKTVTIPQCVLRLAFCHKKIVVRNVC